MSDERETPNLCERIDAAIAHQQRAVDPNAEASNAPKMYELGRLDGLVLARGILEECDNTRGHDEMADVTPEQWDLLLRRARERGGPIL